MNSRFKYLVALLCIWAFMGVQVVWAQESSDFAVQTGEVFTLHSEILDEYRDIYVDYPIDWVEGGKKKYPVAVVLDGRVLLSAVSAVQSFYSGGFTPEMIVVGVRNAEHRNRDLTPEITQWDMPFPAPEDAGGADQFLDFIEKELLPQVESLFPTTGYRTLIGHSYGGLFTMYTLAKRPRLFDNYIAIDPSMDWSGEAYVDLLAAELPNVALKNKGVFVGLSGQLDPGNSEMTIEEVRVNESPMTSFARAILRTTDILSQQACEGFAFDWKFYPMDIHGTVPFPASHDGLISVFEWFQMEHTDKINNPETSVEELEQIILHREAKLKEKFGYFVAPYPEDLLNMSGYMYLQMGDATKSKMYFEYCLKYFPNSANAHDSMGDFYEAMGDKVAALKEVRRAQELAPSEYYLQRIKELEQ